MQDQSIDVEENRGERDICAMRWSAMMRIGDLATPHPRRSVKSSHHIAPYPEVSIATCDNCHYNYYRSWNN